MNVKKTISAVLLLFVLGSLAFLVVDELRRSRGVEGEREATGVQLPHKVIAYYFHATDRCESCRKIEAFTDEAIRKGFADELKNGILEWRRVNVDEPENEHFNEDYELYTRAVVLSDVRHGKEVRWKNLENVWDLLDDKVRFVKYIRTEASSFLEAN